MYNVLIVGTGGIAGGYDTPESPHALTHAHAIVVTQGFNLVGFVGRDVAKVSEMAFRWGGKSFSSLEEAFNGSLPIDVAIVAVADVAHAEYLRKLVAFSVKAVIVEKPIASDFAEAAEVVELYKQRNIPLFVNYNRRALPAMGALKRAIFLGSFGDFFSGSVYYGKGIKHNGSHAIDLIRFLVGEVESWSIINSVVDYHQGDPSVSAVVRIKPEGFVVLHAIPSGSYTLFEVDLLFAKKRIKLSDSGATAQIYEIREDALYQGFWNMEFCKSCDTKLNDSLHYVYREVYQTLQHGNKLFCSGDEALATLQICEGMAQEALPCNGS